MLDRRRNHHLWPFTSAQVIISSQQHGESSVPADLVTIRWDRGCLMGFMTLVLCSDIAKGIMQPMPACSSRPVPHNPQALGMAAFIIFIRILEDNQKDWPYLEG